MASFDQAFTSTRTTEPHFETLVGQLKALDPTAGVRHQPGPDYVVKKATAWTTPQRNATQNIIDTAPATSLALAAQAYIDRLPLAEKAWKLEEVDEFNRIRAALRALGAPGLPALTIEGVLAAWRARAGSLL